MCAAIYLRLIVTSAMQGYLKELQALRSQLAPCAYANGVFLDLCELMRVLMFP